MSGFAERFIDQGRREGRQEGRQEEGALILLHLLTLKFGPPSEAVRARVQAAAPDTLLRWSARVLTATCLEEVLAEGDER